LKSWRSCCWRRSRSRHAAEASRGRAHRPTKAHPRRARSQTPPATTSSRRAGSHSRARFGCPGRRPTSLTTSSRCASSSAADRFRTASRRSTSLGPPGHGRGAPTSRRVTRLSRLSSMATRAPIRSESWSDTRSQTTSSAAVRSLSPTARSATRRRSSTAGWVAECFASAPPATCVAPIW
jgi:hypothetical protein